jgi:hypothetical protein
VARVESPEKARAALLPVGPEDIVPMREVYVMFRGKLQPEQVMTAAGKQAESQFYGHLYVGLYLEALGDKRGALEHITAAADEQYAMGGYMHKVARVHVKELQRK